MEKEYVEMKDALKRLLLAAQKINPNVTGLTPEIGYSDGRMLVYVHFKNHCKSVWNFDEFKAAVGPKYKIFWGTL